MKRESGQKALGLACRFQNEVCDLEEIIELFCLDAEAAQQAIEAAVPQKTFTTAEYQLELDGGFAAQEYCRSLWGAARGHGDWRKFHDAFLAGFKAASLARTQNMRIPDTHK